MWQELKKLLKTEEHNSGNEMGHVKSEADTSGLPGLDAEPFTVSLYSFSHVVLLIID